MRVIIAGSRHLLATDPLRLHQFVAQACEEWAARFRRVITEEVSGHSGTTDMAGEYWSHTHLKKEATRFPYPTPSQCQALGLSTYGGGPWRNRVMGYYASSLPGNAGGLITLWEKPTSGTAGMIRIGESMGLLHHHKTVG